VRLALEPEPGMVVQTLYDFEWVEGPGIGVNFGLTLDVGHLHCLGEVPIADKIRRYRDAMLNVHIEDMRRGVHDHLMFGEGEINFPPILAALKEVGYAGGVFVELSRHSHDAVESARRAIAFLRAAQAAG
jgi:sugar phosphate isomerase/epimerase